MKTERLGGVKLVQFYLIKWKNRRNNNNNIQKRKAQEIRWTNDH